MCYDAYMHITRSIVSHLKRVCHEYPVIIIAGPRQSGKTTLARHLYKKADYFSLEALDTREFARDDPRGFFSSMGRRVIIDEIQRVPELMSYIQGLVDDNPQPGRFILTGSTNLLVLQSVTQTLAGRAAFVTLLPFERKEVLKTKKIPKDLWSTVWTGGYPVIFDRQMEPSQWLGNYITSYVERDVRQVLQISDLVAFQTFLGLCAGRTGQLLNLASLASDCGITQPTAKAWLSVLEASYITARLTPYYANISRRLVKAPKLQFLDSGLVCRLLKIASPEQLKTHPLRGNIFETWVYSEIVKSQLNSGKDWQLNYYRDRKGLEVDLVINTGTDLFALESKSGATVTSDSFNTLLRFEALTQKNRENLPLQKMIIYGGDKRQNRSKGTAIPWKELHSII